MIATISSTVFHSIIPSIAQSLSTTFTEYCDEYTVRLPEQTGSGYIRGIDFEHGLGIAEWNVRTDGKGAITFCPEGAPPLILVFGVEGDLAISVDRREEELIGPLQGVMAAAREGEGITVSWKAETQTRFTIMIVSREQMLGAIDCYLHSAPDRLVEVFRDVDGSEEFFYRSDYSVAVAEAIHAVNRSEMTGVSSTLYLKAKAWEILALMIRQYFDGADGADQSYRSSLKKRDLETLRQARQLLIGNLQDPPTIEGLAREVGLNKNKLQSGFKAMYGTTINRYLRDARLRHAKMLLTEDLKSIGEIAEEVGYSNSSQFSRRFQERYGLLPSHYVSRIRRHRGFDPDGYIQDGSLQRGDIDEEVAKMDEKERSS